MGRYRIKKKEAVVSFRETLAYRLLLITGCVAVFGIGLFQLAGAMRASRTIAIIASAIACALAGIGIFYNLDRARYAKVSETSAKRFRRK
jgi:hypothetical protein